MTETPTGLGVDASGSPVIDPTANVIALVEAAIKRLDDLRTNDAKHQHEISEIRAGYDDKLREAESKRIDAIRAVDVGAVNRAAEVAATQAATLAAQVQASAEALRTQVAATAAQADIKLATALEPIIKDIADLRRAQYEAQGQKTQVVESRDSAADLAPLLRTIERLEAAQNAGEGQRVQARDSRSTNSMVIAIVGLIVAIIVGGSAIYARSGSSSPSAPIVCTAVTSGISCTPAK